MAAMYCPSCEKPLGRDEYHTGEDEGSGDVLMPYAHWICDACGTQINDWEDEYEEPEWLMDSPPDGVG